MNADLAARLLHKVLEWSPEGVGDELQKLAVLGDSGYDDYTMFEPGMRFVESLARWLDQFPPNKRGAAYEFVKDRLLFITRAQMAQIVSVAYEDHVVPILTDRVSAESGGKFRPWQVQEMADSQEFKALHDRCLFMGMSDGAHIDEFRRSNEKISHEQVTRTHEINQARAGKLLRELASRTGNSGPQYFRNVFLIDDFTASGTSYVNESDPSRLKGKIASFYKAIADSDDPLHDLVRPDDLRVYVILYVATKGAIETLHSRCNRHLDKVRFQMVPIHVLPESAKYDDEKDRIFKELVDEFGWQDIMDEHWREGGTKDPRLGFADCALPLILHHNTPNNSLPILYRNDHRSVFRGLFPRVTRHQ